MAQDTNAVGLSGEKKLSRGKFRVLWKAAPTEKNTEDVNTGRLTSQSRSWGRSVQVGASTLSAKENEGTASFQGGLCVSV